MEKQAKRDFGSFHASNVQELLLIPEEDYHPPKIPIELPTFTDYISGKETIHWGKKAKKELFWLEESCCFLNHGAFGAALKLALEVAHKWQLYSERQPLRFYDRELIPLLVHVCRKLAKFIACDARDLVLVNNATFGTSSVLRSLQLNPGDVILTFSITYGASKKLLEHVCFTTGAVNREAVVHFPLTGKQQILDLLEEELSVGPVRLVVIDHIPSNSPFIMPVAEMVLICRKKNARVFIDGAHALGSIPLDLTLIDPDYYVSNGHKWLCCPKGVAFLYVRHELQEEVRPAVISHGLGSGFNSEFAWTGLHDYSPMLALLTVLEFWSAVGMDNILDYTHKTAGVAGSMVLVQLPECIHEMFPEKDYSAAEVLQNTLYHQFNIEVPVKCLQGKLYVRVSAHVHNEISDYEKLAKAVNMIAQKKGNKLL